MRATPALMGISVALLCSHAALAESKVVPTRLVYSAPEGCPDEHDFHTMTAGNLPGSQDPYTETADQTLKVKVTREGGSYVVDFALVDAEGKPKKPNGPPLDRLKHRSETCRAMVEAAALVVLTAVRIRTWAPEAPPAPPAPASPPAAPAPKPPEPPSRSEIPPDDLPPPAPPPKPPEKPPIRGRVEVMPLRIDVRPGTAFAYGLSVEVGMVIKPFSVAGQFHAVPSATATAPRAGGLKTSLATGGLVLCVQPDLSNPNLLAVVFPICVLGEVGQIQALGSNHPGPTMGDFEAVGLHLGAQIPLPGAFYVTAGGGSPLGGASEPGSLQLWSRHRHGC